VRAPRTAARPSAAARPRGATSRPPAARRRSWGPAEGQQILAIYEANPQFLEVILKAIEDMEQWKRAKKRKSKRGLLQSDDSETQGVGTVCSTYATDGSSTTGCTASLTPVDGTGGTGGTVGSSENKCYDFTYCTGDRGYTGCICPDGTTPPQFLLRCQRHPRGLLLHDLLLHRLLQQRLRHRLQSPTLLRRRLSFWLHRALTCNHLDLAATTSADSIPETSLNIPDTSINIQPAVFPLPPVWPQSSTARRIVPAPRLSSIPPSPHCNRAQISGAEPHLSPHHLRVLTSACSPAVLLIASSRDVHVSSLGAAHSRPHH
jgi:hypothetical protein